MLEVICQTTGMGFAAIARVTEDRWLACSVRDEVQFGLAEGGELKIETTICNEIRDHRTPVIIDCVADDPHYKHHHTPELYGLQSYISFPIILKDGTFFGTLCAIDSKPAKLNNSKIIGTFTMFAELLAFHLQAQLLLERSYMSNIELHQQNKALTNVNFDLDNFVYTASHDLKAPIANIEGLIEALSHSMAEVNLDRNLISQIIEMMRSNLKRFAETIKDLSTIVEIDNNSSEEKKETINISEILETVKHDLSEIIVSSEAKIELVRDENLLINFSKKNFKSIIYNLVSNAIKYRNPERTPEVVVKLEKIGSKTNLSVSDNGLGIPEDKQDKVFAMFKRFHSHVEGSGIGLYLVKRLVDNMKGEIQVESAFNKGTTISITF